MKKGDIVEWRGVDRVHRGRVTQSEDGETLVLMDNGHTFSLDDLRFSSSLRVTGHDLHRN